MGGLGVATPPWFSGSVMWMLRKTYLAMCPLVELPRSLVLLEPAGMALAEACPSCLAGHQTTPSVGHLAREHSHNKTH